MTFNLFSLLDFDLYFYILFSFISVLEIFLAGLCALSVPKFIICSSHLFLFHFLIPLLMIMVDKDFWN
jgi:hypothetical protein